MKSKSNYKEIEIKIEDLLSQENREDIVRLAEKLKRKINREKRRENKNRDK